MPESPVITPSTPQPNATTNHAANSSESANALSSVTTFPSLTDRAIVLTGPTASGKTQTALQLCRRFAESDRDLPSLEIISLDSIAVYREMNIGTAKPNQAERASAPHHLIDVVSPDQEFSVAEYLEQAHRCVDEIEARGNRALFVGGTPLYLRAIVQGFDPGPPPDEDFRKAVEADVEKHGVGALHERLQQVDPLSALRIDRNDTRRMIRALEFARQTGKPISHRQTQAESSSAQNPGRLFALQVPRPILHQRIESRTNQMFEAGLVDEVRSLLLRYGELSKTARQAVGYREVIDAIRTGGQLKDAQQQVLFHTRRLARRQETWLRSFPQLRSIATHVSDEKEAEAWQQRSTDHIIEEIFTGIQA